MIGPGITALDRKLLRDLRRLWSQSLAIALVLGAGVALLVLSFGASVSLFETRATYYERNHFAHIFAGMTRAPEGLADAIERIPGVAQIETRIDGFAIFDFGAGTPPAMGRIVSLPPSGQPSVNRLTLRAGRLPAPDRASEVALSESFAAAHGFVPGDRLSALIEGRRRELILTGIVLSPEFIYTLGPGALVPDDRSFGILWLGHEAAAAAFDMDGAFNNVVLRLARGASEPAVISELDRLLEPYGGRGAHGRDEELSHTFLDNELAQLRATSLILPPIFLGVAAFLVNMVLGRLIALERSRIGLFKALGYSDRTLAGHYLKLAMAIGVGGIAVGWALGWWGAYGLTLLYADFFHFPFLIFLLRPEPFVISALAAVAAVGFGALQAVRGALAMPPAVAMAPAMPTRQRRTGLEGLLGWLALPQTATMILRGIARWPGRSLVTIAGVAVSITTLIGSLFFFDSVEALVDLGLYQSNRQDATLVLTEPQTRGVLSDVARLPGVLAAEGTEALAVRLRNGHLSEISSLEGRGLDAHMTRVLDAARRPVALPADGLLISDKLADRMELQAGDTVRVELLDGTRETLDLPVAAVVTQYYGDGTYMEAEALARVLRRTPRVGMVHLEIDSAQLDALYDAIKATPALSGLVLWTDVRRLFQETMGENLGIVVTIYSSFGALIAAGVAYNAARIQLSERAHELASLRVLGFTRAEVSTVLVGEIMLLTLIAVPLGWIGGHAFAALIVDSFSNDMVRLPLVVGRATVGYATLLVVVSSLVSALIVRRALDRLDLVAVLKTRE